MDRSRRNFLFGGFRKAVQKSADKITELNFILRPPGAVSEETFSSRCQVECKDCIQACPSDSIFKVHDPLSKNHQTVYIDEKISGCTYCKDFPCIEACTHDALTHEGRMVMGKAVLLANCLTKQNQTCNMCQSVCPEHVSAFEKDKYGRLEVNSDKCVGCGRCVTICFMAPKAIEIKGDIKEAFYSAGLS